MAIGPRKTPVERIQAFMAKQLEEDTDGLINGSNALRLLQQDPATQAKLPSMDTTSIAD